MTCPSASSSAFVAPRGLINPSNSKSNSAASSVTLTPDGTRVGAHQPLEMMAGDFEFEAFGFAKDVLTAAVTGGSGDIIAQLAEKKKASMDKSNSLLPSEIAEAVAEEPFELDIRRTLSYATFAAGYTGGFQHFLFSNLQENIADPLVRTGLNQGLIIPLCYYSLLVWSIPKLRATSQDEEEQLRANIDVKKMIPRNWMFWVPLQFVQFTFIPTELQVAYCSVLGLVWNIMLSLMTAGPSNTQNVSEEVFADVKITLTDDELVKAPSYKPATASVGERGAKLLRYLSGTAEESSIVEYQQKEEENESAFASVFRR